MSTMRARSAATTRNYMNNNDTGPGPAWMKTLEEKYKILHMKIVFNASAHKRRSNALSAKSGRSNNRNNSKSTRLIHTLSATPLHAVRTPPSKPPPESNTDTNEFVLNDFQDFEDQTSSQLQTSEPNDNKDPENDFGDQVSAIELGSDSTSSLDKELSSDEKMRDIYVNNHRRKQSFASDDYGHQQVSNKNHVSSTILQRQDHIPIREPVREDSSIDHRKKSKLFQKMSKEAQIAISETLSERRKQSTGGKENKCLINNFTNSVKAASRTDLNGNTPSSEKQFKDDRPKSCVARCSGSTSSSVSSIAYRDLGLKPKKISRLPNIVSSRTDSTYKSAGQKNVLIPGVGRYKIPIIREQTFQITGAEYDIRYRDVIRFERQDSITPPSDILEQAMLKCQAWLTKYAVHTKR